MYRKKEEKEKIETTCNVESYRQFYQTNQYRNKAIMTSIIMMSKNFYTLNKANFWIES